MGYSILGIIIEKVSGKSYEEFLRANIFLPAGMESTGYKYPDFSNKVMAVGYKTGLRWGSETDWPSFEDGPGWNLRANGGILSTTEDMFRWYEAIKNLSVLPAKQIDEFLHPYVKEGKDADTYYSYGWVIEPQGNDTLIWHNGGNMVFNAFMGMDLKKGMVIIISSNTDEKISDDYAGKVAKLVTGDFYTTG